MNGIAMPRLVLSPALGAVVAAALVLLMNALISGDDLRLEEPAIGAVIELVQVREDPPIIDVRRLPEPPPPPEDLPEVRPRPVLDAERGYGPIVTRISPPGADGPVAIRGSGMAIPIAKAPPIYPTRAEARGIEGAVVVEFRITRFGTVEDVRVIDADPPGYFERAAVDAVKRYRYRPQMVAGEAVAVEGVRERLVFRMDRG